MKMQAALWYGPEEVRLESVDLPKIEKGEVLVRVGTALTCGTDFKLFRKGHPILVKEVPSPFGHEMGGTVAEIGEGVTGFKPGDRVVAANSAPCEDCFFCKRKEWSLCENLEFLSGTYAEFIKIPARIVSKNLYKIPDHVPFRDAAAAEPLACALHCLEKASLKETETLCIVGAGPCGLLFVQLGKLLKNKVICVGRGQDKLRVAKRLGADHVISTLDEGFEEIIRNLTEEGRGPDVVIEAAGQTDTWELATRLVRKGGRTLFYGGCVKGTEVSVDTHRVHYEEISLSGAFHHTPLHFAEAISLIAQKKIDVSSLIAGERRLADIAEIFRKGVSENPLKIAITP